MHIHLRNAFALLASITIGSGLALLGVSPSSETIGPFAATMVLGCTLIGAGSLSVMGIIVSALVDMSEARD